MPNLIVIFFNLMYPIFYVGFHCMGCVWKRVWRLKTTLKIKGVFTGSLREDFPQNEAMCTTHDWNVKSHDSWFLRVFRWQGLPTRYPRNILFCYFGISSPLCLHLHYVFTYTIYTIIIHILKGVLFREKTLAIILES